MMLCTVPTELCLEHSVTSVAFHVVGGLSDRITITLGENRDHRYVWYKSEMMVQ